MPESIPDSLEKRLKQLLGETVPIRAAHEIHPALELATLLEAKGFAFGLKDLCPKSLTQTQWRAFFTKDGKTFSTDDPQPSIAVCKAVIKALTYE